MRELTVLGTASQVPTRERNHSGFFLRWDREGILFDPGEGTQRQMVFAGVSASSITRICISHFHGDHCLGLPGVLQRMALDGVVHPVDVYFPASGMEHFERLATSSVAERSLDLRVHPVEEGEVTPWPVRLVAARLEHRVDCLGWRIEEAPGRRMLPDRLEAAGVRGPDITRLQQDGSLRVGDTTIRLEDVSVPRRGQVFAIVLDTRPCAAATELARGADLFVCESTFVEADGRLARDYWHMTAADAARVAAEAGARKLVLTHFSGRHPDPSVFEEEARAIFPEVVAASDLMRVVVPSR